MRYARRVSFYVGEPAYNPDTDEYEDESMLVATIPANVTEVGDTRQVTTFGDLDQTTLTVRTVASPPDVWDYLTLDGDNRHYRQLSHHDYFHAHTISVGEEK